MKITPYFIVLLFAVLAITGCKKATSEMPPLANIQVGTPISRQVVYTYQYPAYLQAEQTVALIARVPGFLEQISYVPGQPVKMGQILFTIEPQPYLDQLKAAEAGVKSAEAQMQYAKANYERMKDAVQSRAVSEIDYLQAESVYNSSLAALMNAQAQLNVAQINLSYCYIRAPFDGSITRNLVDKGNMVGAGGQTTNLATIYKDARMFVYFNMSSSEFQNLPKSHKTDTLGSVSITDINNPTHVWKGKIDYTAPDIELSTGTVTVRGIIDNPKYDLVSGMYVNVNIPYQIIPNGILIPENSIGTNQAGRFVYTVNKDNVVSLTPVTVGVLESDGMRPILSGMTKDDRYVVNSMMSVRPGMKINPVK